MSTQKKERKLTPIEEALIVLAGYVECNPFEDYKVQKHIADILGLEKLPKV